MPDFNKVILMGRLCADPELKTTTSGISVTSFRMAINKKITSKDENAPKADFIDIVAWRGTAEFVCKYFTKGKAILVCGSLQSRNWQDKEGNKRVSMEVVADEVTFVENKTSGGGGPTVSTPPPSTAYASSASPDSKFENVELNEDFPF